MVQEPLAPEDDAEDFAAGPPAPFRIAIDDIEYPCERWQTQSSARVLERRYDSGFNGGMGVFSERQARAPNQIYNCVNLDPTTFPYLRMRKGERDQTILTLTSSDTTKPAYGFMEEDSGGVEYLYIVIGARSYKIDLGNNGSGTPALEATTQPGGFSGGEAGRPVRFEGTWYVPLGSGVNARKLTVVGAGDQTNDTWADVGVVALHFASMMNEGVAQLWRAHTTNLVDTSADGSSFGDDFEVGDSSFAITDMLNLSGELFISKPDAPYRFDSQGQSKKVMEFVGATGGVLTNFTSNDGANSGVFGPYAYWAHSTGLWRIWGDSALPIGPEAPANFTPISLDSLTSSLMSGWVGFAAWGRWAYALNINTGLHVGWVESDGTVTWMANIVSGNETSWDATARMGITATSVRPILWMVDTNDRAAIFNLELDGSMRRVNTDGAAGTERGGDNEKGQIWMPSSDFGEPEKQKQMRMAWLTIDNNAYANLDIEMRVHRDRAVTSTQIGSAITSADGDGQFEFVFTPGSSDTFYEAMLAVRFDTNQAGAFSPDTADPRIRSIGMRAVTPHTYKAIIPVSPEGMRGSSLGVKDALKKLRDLKSSEGVPVREPTFNSTFTGYITDVREVVISAEHGEIKYAVEVLIDRWVI